MLLLALVGSLFGSLFAQAAEAPRFISVHHEVRGWNAYYYCSASPGEHDVRQGEALYEVMKAAHAVCVSAVVDESTLQISGICQDQRMPAVYVIVAAADYRCGE